MKRATAPICIFIVLFCTLSPAASFLHHADPSQAGPSRHSSDDTSTGTEREPGRGIAGDGGYWRDEFTNSTYVESMENLSIEDGSVSMTVSGAEPDGHTVGLWHFDEGGGHALVDSGPNFNHGTVHGSIWSDGIIGGALEFLDEDDYVVCGNDVSLNPGEITLEAWLRPETGRTDRKRSDWPFVKRITVDHDKVVSTLHDFPLLFSVTDPDMKDSDNGGAVQPDGGDIRFTLDNGTQLDHEIEYFDGEEGNVIAWVRVPLLSSEEDTSILVHFGNSQCADQENPGGVWDDDFITVHHMEEVSNPLLDSVAGGHNAMSSTGQGLNALGKIDGGDAFDGSNDFTTFAHHEDFNHSGNFTVCVWVRREDAGEQWSHIISKNDSFHIRISSQTPILNFANVGDVSALTPLPNNEWTHLAAVFHPGTPNIIEIFMNGRLDVSDNRWGVTSGSAFSLDLGCAGGISNFFEGVLDEVRISGRERSAAWVNASYLNQHDPDSFYSCGYAKPMAVRKTGSYGIGASGTHAVAVINDHTLEAPLDEGWNHVAETYDGTNMTLYVNGIAQGSANPGSQLSTNSRELLIGKSYRGRVDEVRMYDRALDPSEIREHFLLYAGNGSLRSTNIALPEGCVWSELHFNCSVPPGTGLNISVIDARSGELLRHTASPIFTTSLDLSGIDPLSVRVIELRSDFRSDLNSAPALHNWTVTWKHAGSPTMAKNIGSITVYEETPVDGLVDLSDYFSDPYSRFQESIYSLEHISDSSHMMLELNGSFLSVIRISENWTGLVTVSVSCTNAFDLSTISPNFDIVVMNVNDPPVVKLFSPENGAIIGELSLTLHWKGYDIDNASSDLSYDLYFGETFPPPLTTSDLAVGEWSTGLLADNVTYYWNVIPNDGMDTGGSISGTWSFRIDTSVTAPELILLAPPDCAVLNETRARLRWEATNPSRSDLVFHIYAGTSNISLIRVCITNDTEHILEDLFDNTTYYWKVIPVSGSVQGRSSALWSFRIDVGNDSQKPTKSSIGMLLGSDRIKLRPGENRSTNVTIRNNGTFPASVSFHVGGMLSKYVNLTSSLVAYPGDSRIGMTVTLPFNISTGNYSHTIRAVGNGFGIERTFIIEIVEGKEEDDDPDLDGPEPDKGSGVSTWLLVILIIVVLFILVLSIILVVTGRRSGYDKKKPKRPTKQKRGYTITGQTSAAPEAVIAGTATPAMPARERKKGKKIEGGTNKKSSIGKRPDDDVRGSPVLGSGAKRKEGDGSGDNIIGKKDRENMVGGPAEFGADSAKTEKEARGRDEYKKTPSDRTDVSPLVDYTGKKGDREDGDRRTEIAPDAEKEEGKFEQAEHEMFEDKKEAVWEGEDDEEPGGTIDDSNIEWTERGMTADDEEDEYNNEYQDEDDHHDEYENDWNGEEDFQDERREGMEDEMEERIDDEEDSWGSPYRVGIGDDGEYNEDEYEDWSTAHRKKKYRPEDEEEEDWGDEWVDDGGGDEVLGEGSEIFDEAPSMNREPMKSGEKVPNKDEVSAKEADENEPDGKEDDRIGVVNERENGTLARIPVKRIAVEKETGVEVVLCEDCNKYYKPSEGPCPHCTKGDGDGSGLLGLDPTDKESGKDEGPARRYPEEEMFDGDDLDLEDIIEGM